MVFGHPFTSKRLFIDTSWKGLVLPSPAQNIGEIERFGEVDKSVGTVGLPLGATE